MIYTRWYAFIPFPRCRVMKFPCFPRYNPLQTKAGTQNIASHEQKAQQKLPHPHPYLLSILACETQNFASLL